MLMWMSWFLSIGLFFLNLFSYKIPGNVIHTILCTTYCAVWQAVKKNLHMRLIKGALCTYTTSLMLTLTSLFTPLNYFFPFKCGTLTCWKFFFCFISTDRKLISDINFFYVTPPISLTATQTGSWNFSI